MCIGILIVLPDSVNHDEMNSDIEFDSLDFQFNIATSKLIKNHNSSNQNLFYVTKEWCSCGTMLLKRISQIDRFKQEGMTDKEIQNRIDSLTEKMKLAGKSDKQIENWLELIFGETNADHSKSFEHYEPSTSQRAQIDRWHRFINKLIYDYNIPRVGLLIYWDNGSSSEMQDIELVDTITINTNDIKSYLFGRLQKNVLYYFIKCLSFVQT